MLRLPPKMLVLHLALAFLGRRDGTRRRSRSHARELGELGQQEWMMTPMPLEVAEEKPELLPASLSKPISSERLQVSEE